MHEHLCFDPPLPGDAVIVTQSSFSRFCPLSPILHGAVLMPRPDTYSRVANAIAHFSGRPKVFAFVAAIIIVWILTGPIFHFSDTWQLVINTGTSIVTFLMVFLIQNSQNRDTIAIQLKLDELIRATKGAHNELIDLEELEDDTLQSFRKRYEDLANAARTEFRRRGKGDTGTPEA